MNSMSQSHVQESQEKLLANSYTYYMVIYKSTNKNVIKLFVCFVIGLICYSCEKYCTCTIPGATPKEIEINPIEDCSDYSNAANGDCL